jgi:HD-like signal output (HDOD) protein
MHLLDLVGKKQAPVESRSPAEILKSGLGSLNKLPMLPETATKAMAVANDSRSSLTDLAGVIMRDPTLATGILKLANSPLYRIGRTIDSLGQAVVRLGLRECKNLIITVGMRSLFRSVSPAHKQQCELLWRHSFLTACLCRHLNTALKLGYRGEEFSCGLSHDLGRILIAIGVPNHFDAADPMDFVEGPDLLGQEREFLGTDHCYFGSWFANVNQLPASLVSSIQFHHTPTEAADHGGLVALVTAADHLANHLQRQQAVADYELARNPGWAILGRELDEPMQAKINESIQPLVEAALDEVQGAAHLGAA